MLDALPVMLRGAVNGTVVTAHRASRLEGGPRPFLSSLSTNGCGRGLLVALLHDNAASMTYVH